MRISRARSLVGVVAIVAAGLVTASCCRSPCDRAESTCSTKSTVFQKLVVTNKHTKPITVTPVGDYTQPDGHHVAVTFSPSSAVLDKDVTQIFTSSSMNVQSVNLELKESTDLSSNTYGIAIGAGIKRCDVSISSYDSAGDSYVLSFVNSL